MSDRDYDKDITKAVKTSETMRNGGPNNVLWLIVQQIRYVAGLIIGLHVKVDKLLRRPEGGGGGTTCDLTEVVAQLEAIVTTQEQILERLNALETPTVGSKAGARIVVRGPVENR